MKKILLSALLVIAILSFASAQNGNSKKDPTGKWIFSAPLAPEYYQSGLFQINFVEKKYTASLTFTGSEYVLPIDNVVIARDSLFFNLSLEDESVVFVFKIKDENTMTGQATYSGGVVPVTLSKEMKKE